MGDKKQQSIIDPDNYRNLCEPFETDDAAYEALEKFWEEFYEIRNKHKIADVYVIMYKQYIKKTSPVKRHLNA